MKQNNIQILLQPWTLRCGNSDLPLC